MAYGQTTAYDMADLRAAAESEAGSIYKTDTVQIADGVSIPRGTALTITDGTAAAVELTKAITTNKSFRATEDYDADINTYSVDKVKTVSINPLPGKYMEIVGGYGVSLGSGDQSLAASDFVDGRYSRNALFDSVFSADKILAVSANITPIDTSSLPSDFDNFPGYFSEEDYTTAYEVTPAADKTNVKITVNVVSDGWLDKFLALGRTVYMSANISSSGYDMLPSDYAVDYDTSNPNQIITKVDFFCSAAYGITVRCAPVKSVGPLDALAVTDTAATDARTIAVYTAGRFKKELVPNFSPIYASESITFV